MRTILAWIISGTCAALPAACSSEALDEKATNLGGSGGGQSWAEIHAECATLVNQLTSCGLVTGTRLGGCEDDQPLLECVLECAAAASCMQLQAAYCNDTVNVFAGCLNECRMTFTPRFTCTDGVGIPESWKCDGGADCVGGEDELDCPMGSFACSDGKQIPINWQCDGEADCNTAEDEFDCPGVATLDCGDGSTVPKSLECDSFVDCMTGADESDCAILTCP